MDTNLSLFRFRVRYVTGNLARWLGFLICLLVGLGCSKTIKQEVIMPPSDLSRAINSITIEPFTGSSQGTQFAEYLTSQLAHESFMKVSRSGAEAVLRGTLNIGRVESQSYSAALPITIKKVTKTVYTYSIKKTAVCGVSYSVESKGEVIGGNSYSTSFEETWTGSTAAEALANADSDDVIIGRQLGALARKIVEGISTHKELWSFKLQDAGNDFLKAGNLYYEKGLYAQAEEYWKKAQANAGRPEELAAAHYNIGVYKMKDGNIDEAFKLFQQADHLMPANSVYMDALAKLETAAKGRETLRSMNAAKAESVEISEPRKQHRSLHSRKRKRSRNH